MSIDYFRETSKELAHPRPGGMPTEIIWAYRVANVILNTLNAFWCAANQRQHAKRLQQSCCHVGKMLTVSMSFAGSTRWRLAPQSSSHSSGSQRPRLRELVSGVH